jgi:hypothetical protein
MKSDFQTVKCASIGSGALVNGDGDTFDTGLGGTLFWTLPVGLHTSEGWEREAVIRPWRGYDDAWLSSAFQQIPAAVLVTRLLSRCLLQVGEMRGDSLFLSRQLTVADRIFLLMKLREEAVGEHVRLEVSCPSEDCRKIIDCSFSLNQMVPEQLMNPSLVYEHTLVNSSSGIPQTVRFRLPTGQDQEKVVYSGKDARKELLSLCIQGESLTAIQTESIANMKPEALNEIEDAIEKVDPFGAPEIDCVCPECGIDFSLLFHPASFFLREICNASRGIFNDVHTLAFHYHWSEQEILNMSVRRRRIYLSLLEDELMQSRN